MQTHLFDLSQFRKKKAPMQADFESNNIELLLAFRELVPKCFERLHREIFGVIEPISQDKNLPSVVMSGLMRGELIKLFPEACRNATTQRFQLAGANNEQIFIKKLDDRRRPSNIPTVDSVLIYNQRAKSTVDTAPNIFLGYTATEDWSGFTGTYAVCIDGDKIVWESDLSLLDDNRGSIIVKMPTAPIAPKTPKIKDGVIKIRKKAE